MDLAFADDFEDDRFLLLELPSDQSLSDLLSGQLNLEFVSNDKDPIVLCSSTDSFQLLEFDTSNTLLLKDGATLLAQHFSTFEMRPRPAPFLELRELFRRNPITEAEIRSGSIRDPIRYSALIDVTLCAREQFDALLERLSVVNMEGVLVAPRRELQAMLTNEILQYSLTLENWRRIDIADFFGKLAIPMIEAPIMKEMMFAVLKYHSSEMSETEAILDEKKALRFVAETVLRNARNGVISDAEFEREMIGRLPMGLPLRMEDLRGLFVRNDNQMMYVDEETLPIEFHQRLDALFKIQKKWETKEMEPFFEFHVHSALPFVELITRHARLSDGFWMRR
jgi:hypothetical protein